MPRARFGLVCLAALLLVSFYLELIAHSPTAGMDFAVVDAAARLLGRHADDIYNQAALWPAEQQLSMAGPPRLPYFQPFTNPPLLAVVVRPLAALPVQESYRLWALLNAAAALGAGLLLVRLVLRSGEGRVPMFCLFALSPTLWLCLYYGQMSGLIVGAFALSLTLLARRYPALAGAVLLLAWLKPHIYLPLVALIGISFAARQPRFWAGFLAATCLGVLATLATTGAASLVAWARFLTAFGGGTSVDQADFSSLSSLYVSWLPHDTARALAALLAAAALVAVLALWRRWRPAAPRERWLFFSLALTLWLLAVPYIHPHDDLLLFVACLYLLGRAGPRALVSARSWPLLVAIWITPGLWLLGVRPALVRGLGWIPVLLLLIYLWHSRRPAPAASPLRPALAAPPHQA